MFLVSWLVYKLPYTVEQNFTASTLDGETKEIRIEMKGYRDFFRPTIFRGTMLIDGQVYDALTERGEGLIAKFKAKLNGKRYYPMIASKDRSAHSNFYWILWADDTFSQMYFIHMKDDQQYLAPASNATEAQELLEKIESFDDDN
ncbi:hypothetical protein EBB07_31450 [Paenibacillaceae bacterium]|nr:hypothetical protein EBB07_31450 [Paenibacillaceae bacterium]